MNRRAFFRACGVLLAAPVSALATKFEPIDSITHATFGFWVTRGQPIGDAYENLRAAMREIHAQCIPNPPMIWIDRDGIHST